jgi:hypothetical protein
MKLLASIFRKLSQEDVDSITYIAQRVLAKLWSFRQMLLNMCKKISPVYFTHEQGNILAILPNTSKKSVQ